MNSYIKQTPKNIYAWCCDYEDYRGEGRLARCFVEHVVKNNNKNFYIKTPHNYFRINNQNVKKSKKKKQKKNLF